MSPRRIQSAAGTTTPPFRSPAFPTVSGSPFSPRSALLRPGPRRQGIGFASLRALDGCGAGPGSRIYYEEKRGSVASVAGGDRHGPLPVFGFSWNPSFAGSWPRPRHPTRQTGASPLPVASVTRECLNWPLRPGTRRRCTLSRRWPAGFPSFTGEGKTHQTS